LAILSVRLEDEGIMAFVKSQKLEAVKCVDIDEAANGFAGAAAIGFIVAAVAQNLDNAGEKTITAHLLLSRRVAACRISCCEAQKTAEQKHGLEMHFGIG